MENFSISFVVLTLIIGLWIGTVTGSLLARVFGIGFLDMPLFGDSITLIRNFYLIERLDLRITPAALLGFAVTAILLYRKGKG